MTTLAEALERGQGIERPFRCEVHADSNASASVNVLKGVWVCYACHASGVVDSKRAPKPEELLAMLEPERSVRIYPEAFLELYADPGYWLTRFPDWLCWYAQLGTDPFTGDAVFPVHSPSGALAGLGRRLADPPEKGARYKYPHGWSASRTMFGTRGVFNPTDLVVLVEGAADAVACMGVGVQALAVYGSGIHLPQVDLLARMHPRVILLGFDTDEAGEKAVSRAFHDLHSLAPMQRVRWRGKDPAEVDVDTRTADLARAVARSGYGADVPHTWADNVRSMQAAYQAHLVEARFVEEARR